jgi:DNA polymerase-3 subunit alpha
LNAEHSTLDGINRVETLPIYIRDKLGQTACSVTDHGTVSGSYRFFKSCKKAGIKPIIGMEAYYASEDRTVRAKDHLGKNYHHMVLLSLNNQGLHNLYKLSTASYTTGIYYKPRIDDALLAEHSEGLVATSACLGSYSSQLIMKGEPAAAERVLDHHAAMFKDRFFIEVQLHDGVQQEVNKVLMDIAKRKNYPLVLTADCHYTRQEDKQLHEETLCMQTNSLMSFPPYNHESKSEKTTGRTRFSFGDIDVHVAHHDWMWEQAKLQGIPYEAISNTMALQAMVDSDDYFCDRMNRYPHHKETPSQMKSWELLRTVSYEGLVKRLGTISDEYRTRMDYELKVIKKMGFSDYLLIVQEFQDGARSLDVMVGPGRGSVAGSLVAWALRITEVDPIKYGLVFERWLNPGRAARPLIFDPKLIKNIKELPNEHTHHDCSDTNCTSHSPATIHPPRHYTIHKPVQMVQSNPLGETLMKCFQAGLSI